MPWIMAKAEKTRPDMPTYAEATHPSDAQASVLADDFADLFGALIGWQKALMPDGEYITAYAMPAALTMAGTVAPETLAQWDEGDERAIRLDYVRGGWIKVAVDHEARPNGRPPFSPAIEAPPVRKALTTAPHRHNPPTDPTSDTLYPAGSYDCFAEVCSPTTSHVGRGWISTEQPRTHAELVEMITRAVLAPTGFPGDPGPFTVRNVAIFERGAFAAAGITLNCDH